MSNRCYPVMKAVGFFPDDNQVHFLYILMWIHVGTEIMSNRFMPVTHKLMAARQPTTALGNAVVISTSVFMRDAQHGRDFGFATHVSAPNRLLLSINPGYNGPDVGVQFPCRFIAPPQTTHWLFIVVYYHCFSIFP